MINYFLLTKFNLALLEQLFDNVVTQFSGLNLHRLLFFLESHAFVS